MFNRYLDLSDNTSERVMPVLETMDLISTLTLILNLLLMASWQLCAMKKDMCLKLTELSYFLSLLLLVLDFEDDDFFFFS